LKRKERSKEAKWRSGEAKEGAGGASNGAADEFLYAPCVIISCSFIRRKRERQIEEEKFWHFEQQRAERREILRAGNGPQNDKH
jgi:hypothetical protein